MPAPGDQHSVTANPFEEAKPRISEYTAQEVATLQSRLEKQLGPEYLSSRAGPGGAKVHYIAAEKCIALANEVFGFNGWSSSIQKIDVDFAEENPQTLKISLGLSVIVRVTLRDGTFHEDIGYGQIENCKSKAQAFEKAKKEGTTDALKRALRNFGNVLGNCIYDKAYVQKVAKMKVEPHKFDEDGLHRHANYVKKEVQVKSEPTTSDHSISTGPASDGFEDLLEEFEEADFCVSEEGHPDEVSLVPTSVPKPAPRPIPPATTAPMQPPSRPMGGRSNSGGAMPPRPPQTPNQARPNGPGGPQNPNGSRPPPPQQQQQQQQQNYQRPPGNQGYNNVPAQRPGVNGAPQPPPLNQQRQQPQQQQQNRTPTNGNGPEPAATFFSARAVPKNGGDSESTPRQPDLLFNPKAESPSIRKTPGIDHSKSLPLSRSGQHVPGIVKEGGGASSGGPPAGNNRGASPAPAAGPRPPLPPQQQQQQQRGNVVHPQLDQTRRIGAPPAAGGSPLANRGQYKPPTMKRPLPTEGVAGRQPLADLPSNAAAVVGGGAAGMDAKRVKTG